MSILFSSPKSHLSFLALAAVFTHSSCLADMPVEAAEEHSSSHWGLGLVVMPQKKIYRGMDDKLEVWPLITYENRWVKLAGPGLDIKLGKTGSLSYALTANYVGAGYKADDSSYLEGMDERKGGVWLGGRLTWTTEMANLSAAWQADASGNSNGQKFSVGLSRRFAWSQWGLTPRLTATWHNDDYVDYYYGVTAAEARAGRLQYTGSAAINTEIGLRLDYRVTAAQTVFLDTGLVLLGSSIKDSPLVDRRTSPELRLGYLYRF